MASIRCIIGTMNEEQARDDRASSGAEPAGAPAAEDAPAADSQPWAGADRPRGLDAYFPPGGEDEAPPERVADERRLMRLLVLLVVLLVGVPTLLTLIAFVGQLMSLRGGG